MTLSIDFNDAAQSGLYRTSTVHALERAAVGAGLAHWRVDLTRAQDHKALFDVLARDLQLPDYFGKNSDALYDCLTDMTDVVIVLEGEGSFASREPLAWAACLDVFHAAASNARSHRERYFVLVDEAVPHTSPR